MIRNGTWMWILGIAAFSAIVVVCNLMAGGEAERRSAESTERTQATKSAVSSPAKATAAPKSAGTPMPEVPSRTSPCGDSAAICWREP